MANVYVLKHGTLSNATKQFNLTPYYYSSLKKALKVKERILKDNEAQNQREGFESSLYQSLVECTDYDGEQGKYVGRVIIEKETVW